jgi:hypothetical protein
MRRPTGRFLTIALTITLASAALGAQQTPARPGASGVRVCSLLTTAEVEKYIARGRTMYSTPEDFQDTCSYGASWGQVLVYSGSNAEQRFDRHLEAFKKDKEPRYPLASLGPSGWVMYPRPDNKYQPTGAFTHATVGPHVVAVFVDADEGKPAESAKSNAEALTKLVVARLR